jgi:hypothetical protein
MKAGQSESFSFAYSAAAAPSSQPASASSTSGDTVAVALVIGVALAAFVLLVLGVNKKMQAKTAGEYDVEAARAAAPAHKRQTAEKALETRAEKVSEPSHSAAPAQPTAPNRKPTVILGVVVGILGVFAVLALANGGKATVSGDTISLNVAQVDTCSSASIALATPQGGDLAKDANKILAPLKSVTGVGNATIYLSQARLEVNFCDSSTSEEAIRAALAGTGYVSAAAPAQSAPSTGTAVQ